MKGPGAEQLPTPQQAPSQNTIPGQPEGWSLTANFPFLRLARVTPNPGSEQSGMANSPFC